MTDSFPEILTIGHSTHPITRFMTLLNTHGVESLMDVRSFPGSRRHPQFNKEALVRALEDAGVAYYHMVSLGGRRKALEGACQETRGVSSPFAAYAEYARTASFRTGLDMLESLALQSRVAIMCAEANWQHCHRSLIAKALAKDGFPVTHIMPPPATAEAARSPELPGL